MQAVVLTRDVAAAHARFPYLSTRHDLRFIEGDVRNFAFPTGTFDHVVHAATEASAKLNEERPQEMLQSIIGGTRRVLDFSAQAGVRSLLLTSSGAVYGHQPASVTHLHEDHSGAPDPLLTTSAYGEGKRVAEHMCVVDGRLHGYEVKIARCFAFVGPGLPLDTHFAIGNFLADAMAARTIHISGDGRPLRSYLYAADLAAWLWTLLFRGTDGRAYNVGASVSISILDLARMISQIVMPTVAVTVAKPAPPDNREPPPRYVPCVSRAAKELDLQTWTPLESAIQKTVRWHMADLPSASQAATAAA